MNLLADTPSWYRLVLAVLIALQAVCAAISAGAVAVPGMLHDAAPWAGLANIFLVVLLAQLNNAATLRRVKGGGS